MSMQVNLGICSIFWRDTNDQSFTSWPWIGHIMCDVLNFKDYCMGVCIRLIWKHPSLNNIHLGTWLIHLYLLLFFFCFGVHLTLIFESIEVWLLKFRVTSECIVKPLNSTMQDIQDINNLFGFFWMFKHYPSKFGKFSLKIGWKTICQIWPLHNLSIVQCTMGELKNGVKSSQLWRIISLWILAQNLPNLAQSCLNSPKTQINTNI